MYPKTVPMPRVPGGAELQLRAQDWEYGRDITGGLQHGPIELRVGWVRDDLSRHYGGQMMWIEGWRLDPATGLPFEGAEVLVRTNAPALQPYMP